MKLNLFLEMKFKKLASEFSQLPLADLPEIRWNTPHRRPAAQKD
jgi:hypothetical protein